MKKKEYMKPSIKVVKSQQKNQILAGSVDTYGMNKRLRTEDGEVTEGW